MRAIDEMKKVGSKGTYTGRTAAKVAEWVVRSEVGVYDTDSFVPDERRLRDVDFDFDRVAKFGKVRAVRRKGDGTSELLAEDLDLSLKRTLEVFGMKRDVMNSNTM